MKNIVLATLVTVLSLACGTARAASYTVNSSKSATTILGIADDITFTGALGYPYPGGCSGTYQVWNRSNGDMWIRPDGPAPTVGGDDTFVIPNQSMRFISALGGNTIKVISGIAAAYTVECR